MQAVLDSAYIFLELSRKHEVVMQLLKCFCILALVALWHLLSRLAPPVLTIASPEGDLNEADKEPSWCILT